MGASSDKIINEKIRQITNYYIFHKKIESILNKGKNSYNSNNKDIKTIFIIKPNWIKAWKVNCNYDVIKKELDEIDASMEESTLLNKLEEKCFQLINQGLITNTNNISPPSMDNNKDFINMIVELQYFNNEIFDYLVDFNTYKSLFNIFNPMNLINIPTIKGIIKSKMIILVLEQINKVKFIYKGKLENENKNRLIQLTAHFSLEKKFKNFCEKIKNLSSNEIINNFENNDIYFYSQVNIKDGDEFDYILKNENLDLKYRFMKNENRLRNIQFPRNDISPIGLNNIYSPAYLNAVMQNLINISILTNYFLNENNYQIIKKNYNSCYLIYFYCEVLINIYCENENKFFDLKDFNEIIYLLDYRFKFNIDCIPGDLFKYLLERMYFELYQLFNMNYINQPNIIDFFKCLKGKRVQCEKCKYSKIYYDNSFVLEFSLDVLYECYKDSLIKNSNEKYIITLEHCFENYVKPFFYKLEDDDNIFCEECKTRANIKSQNEFYLFPYILIIVLNKEIDNNEYIFTFPEKLNLFNYISKMVPQVNKDNLNQNYIVRGIITHNNSFSDNQNKYYTFCKHINSNEWHKYNDLVINKCTIKDAMEQNMPDILIYECIPNNYNNIRTSLVLNNNNDSFLNNSINQNTLCISNNNLNININNSNNNEIQKDLINIDNNINNSNDNKIEDKYTKEEINIFNSMRKKMTESDNIINQKNINDRTSLHEII